MNNHRFILEPYQGMKTRHTCPGCGKKGVFVRYIDQATGEPLAGNVGRCNRETNCGYHYKPGDYFRDNKHLLPDQIRVNWTPPPQEPPKPPTFISPEIFKASRAGYNQNNFVKWLQSLFDETTATRLIGRYHIGTSNHWPGATVFWQIDQAGRIRTGKIMGYNPTTGRRIKEPQPQITFVHRAIKMENFNLKQCYFGEHLLTLEPQKPVGLVESEKTAIVANVYFPGFVWLAVGSLTNINPEKCKQLTGRRVILFPDLGGFDKWKTKAGELQKAIPGTVFSVSDILERGATSTDRENGFDLADYLTKFDWRTFAGEPSPGNFTGEPLTRATDQEPDQDKTLMELRPVEVVNLKNQSFDIYIGRENKTYNLPKSKWLNPFSVKEHGRQKAIELFRQYIIKGKGKHLLNDLHELRGKTLGCWCKPEPCHGDILKQLVENGVESLNYEKHEKNEALKTNHFSPQEPKPTKPTKPTPVKNENWPVDELEKYFAGVQLPREPIRRNRWEMITDVSKFIENQLKETKAQNGNPYFKPGFERLVELKNYFQNLKITIE